MTTMATMDTKWFVNHRDLVVVIEIRMDTTDLAFHMLTRARLQPPTNFVVRDDKQGSPI